MTVFNNCPFSLPVQYVVKQVISIKIIRFFSLCGCFHLPFFMFLCFCLTTTEIFNRPLFSILITFFIKVNTLFRFTNTVNFFILLSFSELSSFLFILMWTIYIPDFFNKFFINIFFLPFINVYIFLWFTDVNYLFMLNCFEFSLILPPNIQLLLEFSRI